MAHDVFICHSSRDKEIADAVCSTLEAQGMTCWIAPRDIQAGTSYAEGIISAISNAKAMILVFSATANSSQQVEREIERAVHHNIPLIPFRIENIRPERALEYFLSTPHWLDAYTPPLEPHLAQLATQVKALLGRTSEPAAAPPAAAAAAVVAPIAAAAVAAPAVAAPLLAAATPHGAPVPPPHRGNNTLVLVAGGVVAFSVLVLAAVIFLKPFGAPAAAPTNTAPANVLAVADTNAPGAQRSVVPTATPPANAAAQPPAAPTPAQPAPSPTVATASPPPAPAAPPATTPARLSPGECRTSDPTGTPLNVRGRPGGEIVGALDDGIVVRVIDHRQGVQGRLWAMVEPVNHAGQSGWVFENFLNCPGGDPGAAEATRADQTARGPEPQPERPFGPRAGPGGRFRRGMGGGPG